MATGGIIVLKNNAPQGPYSQVEILEGLKQGDFTLNYLAHAPGLKNWLPLGEVLHHWERTELPPVPLARSLPPLPTVSLPSSPMKPARPPLLPQTDPASPYLQAQEAAAAVFAQRDHPLVPAPFFQRFLACLIDGAILFVPIVAVFCTAYLMVGLGGMIGHQDAESIRQAKELLWRHFRELVGLVAIGFAWLYAAGLESSRWQATVGKQWMGMVVADGRGERLSFLHATGRHFAKYISALPVFGGFIMALFNSRRLALHDRLAGTCVIKN